MRAPAVNRACKADHFLSSDAGFGLRLASIADLHKLADVGEKISLVSRSIRLSELSLPHVMSRITNPALRNQSKTFYDSDETAVGFLSWAWLDSDCIHTGVLVTPQNIPHDDWDAGGQLCIVDAFIRGDCLGQMIDYLSLSLYPAEAVLIQTEAGSVKKWVDTYLTPAERKKLSEATLPEYDKAEFVDVAELIGCLK
jgi:hemolysin-activating ACP:hemolysin acyltransferase